MLLASHTEAKATKSSIRCEMVALRITDYLLRVTATSRITYHISHPTAGDLCAGP